MSKFKSLILLMLLTNACAMDPFILPAPAPFSITPPAAPPVEKRMQIASIPSTSLAPPTFLASPTLPSHYVECGYSFFWNMQNFSSDIHHRTPTEVALLAKNAFTASIKRGENSWSMPGLNTADHRVCTHIRKQFMGSIGVDIEYAFIQSFDAYNIENLNSFEFKEIDTTSGQLLLSAYWSPRHSALYELKIPVSTFCTNKWQARQNSLFSSNISFMAPQNRCYFAADDFKIDIAGKTETIALHGYYEKDPEYSDRTLVRIEKIGFRNF